MRAVSSSTVTNLVANLQRSYDRIARLQNELATGTKINNPSDDPAGTQRSLAFRSDIRENEQFQRNISESKGWLNMTETSLSGIEEALINARSLAMQGASSVVSANEKRILADEIDQVLERALGLATTTRDGKYIFGGTDTGNNPLVVTRNVDGHISSISVSSTATGSIEREISDGVRVQINATAGDVFGGTDSPLGSLINLRDRLVSNDMTGISQSINDLEAARQHVTDIRGEVGSKTNRLDMTENILAKLTTDLQGVLSETEDVDIAEHMMNLQQEQALYQAAVMTANSILPPTLAQYLG